MGAVFIELLKSKKAMVAILSVVGMVLSKVFGLNIPTQDLFTMLSPAMAYIVGQGIADNGKERVKEEKKVRLIRK